MSVLTVSIHHPMHGINLRWLPHVYEFTHSIIKHDLHLSLAIATNLDIVGQPPKHSSLTRGRRGRSR